MYHGCASQKKQDELGFSAVVIKKAGHRRLYDTARDHSIRLATASGQLPVSWDVWSAMRKLTTRQLESRLPRDTNNHRCEITGVKFRAGLLSH